MPSRPARSLVGRVLAALGSAAVPAVRAWRTSALALPLVIACEPTMSREAPSPPAASFLVAAGDSTFWVESGAGGVRVRRSPMLLAEFDGAFHELYVVDDDRSYFDAFIVGQRLFRRNLATGDSTLLLEDRALAGIARAYAKAHPDEPPLAPDEDGSSAPTTQASTETELLDAVGPYLTFEQHVDIDVAGLRDEHHTRRGVLDVRDGRAVSVRDLAGDAAARSVHAEGRRLLAAAIDSIRRVNDERARRARQAIAGFVFDSLSFGLVEDGGAPAIEFLVPGRGARAGGYALPLAPVRIPPGAWWEGVRALLPSPRSDTAIWPGPRYDVVVTDDSVAEWASVSLRRASATASAATGRSAGAVWNVARVPTPLRRVRRLDDEPKDSLRLRALSRAFDESALYSGQARTALARTTPVTPASFRPTRARPWRAPAKPRRERS